MLKSKISRVKQVIESDRLGVSSGMKEIIRRDAERLLSQYFTLNRPVTLKISGEGGKISVIVEADCASAKRFNLLK